MATLEQILDYLERDGVKEVVLLSGGAPCVRIGTELRRLSNREMSAEQLLALVAGTPLAPLVPVQDEAAATASFDLGGRIFVTKISRFGDRLQIRIARSGVRRAASADPPKVAPAPLGSSPSLPSLPEDPPSSRSVAAASPSPAAGASPGNSPDARPSGLSALDLSASPRPASASRAEPDLRAPKPVPSGGPAAQRPSTVGLAVAAPRAPSPELAALLRDARARGASDVHVSSDRPAQIRVAGELVSHGPPIAHEMAAKMVFSVLEARHSEALASVGYADLSADLDKTGRLRVNVCRHRAGLKGCFRLVAATPSTLEQLGLPRELEKVTLYHQGLVVISGPSGQGKSTTMAALVHMFNSTRPVHIITVEDPVEIVHPVLRAVVSQREVGTHTKSFHAALKGSLREDPDIIVIGELRDRETVEMALSAAETGHLVIATMSTPSAARTIDRIIDMFPPDDQAQVRATLAGALKLVISQRLLPKADGSGLVAAIELITGSLPLWTLIRDSKLYQLPSLMQRGHSWGMIRLEESINELLAKGSVTLEAARAHAHEPRLVGLVPEPAEVAPAQQAARSGQGLGGLKNLFGRKDKE